jgi:hypothetical protein
VIIINGIFQNFWVKDHRQIYLLGNPMVWLLSTASIAGYVAVRGFLILRAQRGYRDFESSTQYFYVPHGLFQQSNPPPPFSQGCQVRHAMWLPLHGVESPLLPVLPHESPVIPASLSPRPVFRDLTALRGIRLFDVDAASTLASPNRGSSYNSCYLEFLDLQPACVWEYVDER